MNKIQNKYTFILIAGLILAYGGNIQSVNAQDRLFYFSGKKSNFVQSSQKNFLPFWKSTKTKKSPLLTSKKIKYLDRSIAAYSAIVKRGGWRRLPSIKYRPGMSHKAVSMLRKRLIMTGDMNPGGFSKTKYDYYVEKGVRNFQYRHGLPQTGIVKKRTLSALNVSASARLKQLRRNRVRLKKLSPPSKGRYVVVNIPAARVEAVENGRLVSQHKAVVGKTDRQTPLLKSRIHEINFNPYWHVPQSIVEKDLVPRARREAKKGRKNLLDRFKIEAFDGRGRKIPENKINWASKAPLNYHYRQLPWKNNSMGFVKINFPNKHAVFMHDTPSKRLFGRSYRAASSGCIRIQNIKQLVAWLLKSNKGWSRSSVSKIEKSGERKDVKLARSVPLYFVYVSAWGSANSQAHFRQDLYGYDGVGRLASNY